MKLVNTLILRLVRLLIRRGQGKKFPFKVVNGLPLSVPKPGEGDRREQTWLKGSKQQLPGWERRMGAEDSSSNGRGRGLESRTGFRSGLRVPTLRLGPLDVLLSRAPWSLGGFRQRRQGARAAGGRRGGPAWPISKCPRLSCVLLSVGLSDSAAQQGHGV